MPVTPRLKAALAMRRTAPDGQERAPDAFVFGSEVGEQVSSVNTAWASAAAGRRSPTCTSTICDGVRLTLAKRACRSADSGVARAYDADADEHLPERH